MPEQNVTQIDESKIPAKLLFRILPEASINELAKSLLDDISNSPPPFFTQAGEELFTHGMVDIRCGDEHFINPQITTSVSLGKDAIDSAISHMIDNSDKEIESLGDKDAVINKVGLFILSNINGMGDLHEFAISLFREIGALAYFRDDGEIETGEIEDYMETTIERQIKNSATIKDKLYWQGVEKHIIGIMKTEKISQVKLAISTFNSVVNDRYLIATDEIDERYQQEVIDNVIEYFLNPIAFVKDNPDMMINLSSYEEQRGKLPRQPELPGMEQT